MPNSDGKVGVMESEMGQVMGAIHEKNTKGAPSSPRKQ